MELKIRPFPAHGLEKTGQIHRLETTGICFGPSTFAGAAISPVVGLAIPDLEAAKPLDNPGRSFSASKRSKKPAPL